jgi:hypothetical protein
MMRCPSDLELERMLLGPTPGQPPGEARPTSAHVFGCPRCAARVAELRRLGQEFEDVVFPATVEAVVAASAPVPLRPRAVWLVPALAAAAALALVVLRPWSSREEAGGSLALLAYASTGSGALADGQGVPAGAALRFEIRPGRSCNLFVASVDGTGKVLRLFPPKALTGTAGLSVEAGKTVAVSAGAAPDGHRGPERYFAVCGCGDDPLYWPDVDRAARAIAGSEDQLRGARALSGLPGDTLQATLLVEKEP